jgi:SpoVK/Ycf46/Vps4 family AAA+-type ATPase
MAAEVLAHELGLPLWRMEAAELESPFVGESEARLHSFFASVKGKPAVLLLDEADTVLMNRSETTGSTQRYQNNLVNTWLRELDRFEGILVLTTNHADGLDPAVERRIQYRMAFDSPSTEVRAQIWMTLLGESPIPGRDTLDLQALAARYPFSGGRIRNAFIDACQRAADGGAMSQEVLLAACEEEQQSALNSKPLRTIRGFAAHSLETA